LAEQQTLIGSAGSGVKEEDIEDYHQFSLYSYVDNIETSISVKVRFWVLLY
jgi:hypothetical protein